MFLDRREIKARANALFHMNYWPLVGYCAFIAVVSGVIGSANAIPGLGSLVSVILLPIITVSYMYQLYRTYELEEKPDIASVFAGFKDGRFGHILGGYWYRALFIFLWSLLFVIPGIVKAYSYRMTDYILMDKPEISATDALKISMEMTRGHKWEMFVFDLSFLGWHILSMFTCGILEFFFVMPYQAVACAGIYSVLKAEYEKENGAM